MVRIDSFLSARLFLAPQWVGRRIYFISNLSGALSLYAMDQDGSVPEPLLPPNIALQNPELMGGHPFFVFPKLGKILVMIDRDGDENYQPMLVPLDGGFPVPAFGAVLENDRVHCSHCDEERNIVYLGAESRRESMVVSYRGLLDSGTLEELGRSPYGREVSGVNEAHSRAVLVDHYTMGDHVVYLWSRESGTANTLLFGTPLDARSGSRPEPLNSIGACHFTEGDRGLLFLTSLLEDTYGLGYLRLGGGAVQSGVAEAGASPAGRSASPGTPTKPATGAEEPAHSVRDGAALTPEAVRVTGTLHTGHGEMTHLEHLRESRYLVGYNIDGCSWLYEGVFDEAARRMDLTSVVCGAGAHSQGVAEACRYDKSGDRFTISFSTAVSPTQISRIEGADRKTVTQLTRERVLGIPVESLSAGEDASFTSHDGTRVSARLYRPSPAAGFQGPRPVVYYVHGGPQSQERPNFAWFSMPLIQFLTLNGFAVFVPNARGSTGYGLRYTKEVDRDWGGRDRLDHVHAMTKVLPRDERLNVSRAGVVGRSYGGYMTLTLAARHPELWSAAIDMFGPFDLLTFLDRIPETWKPYFDIALGNPAKDREFLVERSPRTHLQKLACPLLVIQGKNDPRVVERESRDLVEHLRASGKQVDYLMFENEGHDVLKHENRVRCYNAITDFFKEHLKP